MSSASAAEVPRCECHGEPMLWNRDPKRRKGGWWRCREKTYERARKLHQKSPEKQRARNRLRERRAATEKDQETIDRILAENPWLKEITDAKKDGTERRQRAVA